MSGEAMGQEMNIQWFPGHMTKALRMMADNLKNVDAVCEILDARIPRSSHNPDLDGLIAGKPRLVILNRIDQADPAVTALWKNAFRGRGWGILETDCKSGKGVASFPGAVKNLLSDKLRVYAEKGQTGRALRVMVAGIPNVGKSSFINRAAGRRAAETSDRPGVTRGKQWIRISGGLELLDTPGVLWPRFENQEVGENLAFTGAVKDEILDRVTLGANLLARLSRLYPGAVEARYKAQLTPEMNGYDILQECAMRRGFLISRGEYDLERMAAVALDEFRGGKLGRLSLERPEETQA